MNAGNRAKERDVLRRQHVAAANVNAGRDVEQAALRRRDDHREELVLEILDIRRLLRVEDDEIRSHPLRAPVVMRDEQLPHAGQSHLGANRGEHDWPVAGDAVCPQCRLTAPVRDAFGLRRAQRFAWIDERPGEILERRRGFGRDVEIAQLDLCAHARQREGTLGGSEVVVPIRSDERLFTTVDEHGGERDDRGPARLESHPCPQRHDGIEHSASGIRERSGGVEREGSAHGPPAANEARAIGLAGDVRGGFGSRRDDVHAPRAALAGRAGTPAGEYGRLFRQPLGFHEEILKCGMRPVGTRRGEHDLRVARQLDLAIDAGPVGDRYASDLRALAGHHDDLGRRIDCAVGACEDHAIGGERHVIRRRGHTDRLMRDRPHGAGRDVANVDPLAGGIAGCVGAPAIHVHVSAATVPAAGVREQHGVRLPAEQSHLRLRGVRRVEVADDGVRSRCANEGIGAGVRLGGTRGVTTWHPLVEQQGRATDGGVRKKATLPDALASLEIERVVQRDDRHADVMRHEGAHDCRTSVGLRACVVERIVVPKLTERAQLLERHEIAQCRVWVDGECKRRGVGSDNEIATEAALEREIGHPKSAVLIGFVTVASIVRRLRDSPRHAALAAVGDMAPNSRAMRLVEQ